MRKCLIPLFLLATFPAWSQVQDLGVSRSYYSRFIVPDHMVFDVTVPYVKIDTLIMEKKSVLRLNGATTMIVGKAFIGKNAMIDGRGRNGKPFTIKIHFIKLGRLTINTSGGPGSPGRRGRAGVSGTSGGTGTANGGPGGPGGDGSKGGDGGDLTVSYSSNGFPILLGKAKRNSLVLNCKGGIGGAGGPGGPGGSGGRPTQRSYVGPDGRRVTETNGVMGTAGPAGPSGYAGSRGKDGVLTVEEIH